MRMTDLLPIVAQLDSILQGLSSDNQASNAQRRQLRDAILSIGSLSSDHGSSLADTIRLAASSCPSRAKRTLASVMIRLVSSSGVFKEQDKQKCRKEIVSLVEESCPDLIKGLFKPNDQNHEKVESLGKIHNKACDHLDEITQPFASLQDLANRRRSIMRSINNRTSAGYLNAFGFKYVQQTVGSLLDQVEKVVEARGHELQTSIQQLVADIPVQLERCNEIGTFVTSQYAVPFLERLQRSALEMKNASMAEFACRIAVPDGSREPEKKYPLHLVGSEVEISVPLINTGPGVAQSVRTFSMADHGEVRNAETNLGNVEPGPFILTLVIELAKPTQELQAEVEIKWIVVGDPDPRSEIFTTVIRGQRDDLDWDQLAHKHPYNLEVALADDFYGRRDVLNRITRRLTSNTMQSCYITGQKRVGKSSLARAVKSAIEKNDGPFRYHVRYLECGEIMHSSGEETLAELGRQLEDYFARFLGQHIRWEPQKFSSSLTPLNRLLDTLKNEDSTNRFVVILDEIDEINESLYSHGELAKTFFLNLRTLASKTNLAFVLVGAEKMPYLMSSQGERLNKFEKESLDSFDRETEWPDFRSLVRDPVTGEIIFHESALRRLYGLTDGHPYFTKALCAKAFELAVAKKDAEISDVDVGKAGRRLVASLGSNAFAHYWRDGTRGGEDEVEIASVRRCRTLISWARAERSGVKRTHEQIERHLYGNLRPDEMRHELDDFCRRGVFKVENGNLSPRVELFGEWLRDNGFALLVGDQVGGELEKAQQQQEDQAYVKPSEILELVDRWPLYQGRRIAEERVRAWIEQTDSKVEQRWLFTLLQNVRFITDEHVQDAFRSAYEKKRRNLPVFVQRKRVDRRRDVLVTYFGGAAKSGAHYANKYAQENKILQSNVLPADQLEDRFRKKQQEGIKAIVVVDDMIGTGNSLVGDLQSLSEVFGEFEFGSTTPLFVCVFCATVEGEGKVRRYIGSTYSNSDLHVCEILDSRHYAFDKDLGFWSSEDEKQRAESMVRNLGARVDKSRPLGYRDQGLLLTFSRNCPNNCLPILFRDGKGVTWQPLFPRMQM